MTTTTTTLPTMKRFDGTFALIETLALGTWDVFYAVKATVETGEVYYIPFVGEDGYIIETPDRIEAEMAIDEMVSFLPEDVTLSLVEGGGFRH